MSDGGLRWPFQRSLSVRTTASSDLRTFSDEYDLRGNKKSRALAESIWAVRVLRGLSAELVEAFWGHLEAIHGNTQDGLFPPHAMDLTAAQALAGRPLLEAGVAIATVINAVELRYKMGRTACGKDVGMDCYIDSRTGSSYTWEGISVTADAEKLARVICMPPDGRPVTMCNRKRRVRDEFYFHFRGRSEVDEGFLQEREAAWQELAASGFARNRHAGITVPEMLTEELRDFFVVDVEHGGKAFNKSGTDAWEYRAFRVPFIGGASGSILYAVLSMEDTLGGLWPSGVVASCHDREVLLGLHCAALIAGGQHSLGECLLTLQAMGYFNEIPQLMRGGSYLEVVAAFETMLSRRGVVPMSPDTKAPSSPLGDLKFRLLPTRMEKWAATHLSRELQALHDMVQELWRLVDASQPVLAKDLQPSDPAAQALAARYEARLAVLWAPAFAYVEIARGADDPLALLALAGGLASDWIDNDTGKPASELHGSVLLNMLGQADVVRLQLVVSESEPLELSLSSVHVSQVVRRNGPSCYILEATFISPGLRALKHRFFTGVVTTNEGAYARKSTLQVVGRRSHSKPSVEDPDVHCTLAYIREGAVEATELYVANWLLQRGLLGENGSVGMHADPDPTVLQVSHIVLETGRPHFGAAALSELGSRRRFRLAGASGASASRRHRGLAEWIRDRVPVICEGCVGCACTGGA